MNFQITYLDSNEILINDLPFGEYSIGRGPLLKCDDPRVSRKHGCIIINHDKITLTSLHQNPLFYHPANEQKMTVLKMNTTVQLNDGDKFTLLADKYWYLVKMNKSSEQSIVNNNDSTNTYNLAQKRKLICDEYSENKRNKVNIDVTVKDTDSNDETNSGDSLDFLKSCGQQNLKTFSDNSQVLNCDLKNSPLSQKHKNKQIGDKYSETKENNSDTDINITVKDVDSNDETNSENSLDFLQLSNKQQNSSVSNDNFQVLRSDLKQLPLNQGSLSNSESVEDATESEILKYPLRPETISESDDDDLNKDDLKIISKNKIDNQGAQSYITHSRTHIFSSDKECEENSNANIDNKTSTSQNSESDRQNAFLNSTETVNSQIKDSIPTTSATSSKRERCAYGASCYRKNAIHVQKYSHPGNSDYDSDTNDDRPICLYGTQCYRKNPNHHREYKHPPKCLKNSTDQALGKRTVKKDYAESSEDDYDFEDPFIDDNESDFDIDSVSNDSTSSDGSESIEEKTKRLVKEAKRFMKGKR